MAGFAYHKTPVTATLIRCNECEGWNEMATLEDKLKAAEEKVRKLREQKAAAERRAKAVAAEKARKEETRKKILAGAVVLNLGERDPKAWEWLQTLLDRELTRDDDRALFGLPPLVPAQPAGEPAAPAVADQPAGAGQAGY